MSTLAKTLTRLNAAQISSNATNNNFKNFASKCGSKQSDMNPNYSKRMIKFKQLQKKFQRDDGNPIFLKAGPFDRVLYLSTMGLGILGLILDLKFYGDYIFDKK